MQYVKLNSLAQWAILEKGTAVIFSGGVHDYERAVTVYFNLETVTTLYIEPEDKNRDIRMLCTAGPGLVRLDFNESGVFGIFADDQAGEVQWQSTEMVETSVEAVDPVTFTEIIQRKPINEEFELMWYRANQKMDERMAALAEQYEARLAAVAQEAKNNATSAVVPPVVAKQDEAGTPSSDTDQKADGVAGGEQPSGGGS